MEYLGYLSSFDPLYFYLTDHIVPQLKIEIGRGKATFQVHRLHAPNHVFLYEEIHTHIRLIGKFFFGVNNRSYEDAVRYLVREFNCCLYFPIPYFVFSSKRFFHFDSHYSVLLPL